MPVTAPTAPPPLRIHQDRPPLKVWADGSIRVGGTRLLLEHVLEEYLSGKTPEELDERFESISLADAYSIVAYYHQHRADVDAYLAWVEAETKRIDEEMRAAFPQPTKSELLARLAERNASAPH